MTHNSVPIEISARHIHLSASDLAALFGQGSELTVLKKISQPGQFAANETVSIIGPKAELQLRIVGPIRQETQVELSLTDAMSLGLEVQTRVSGDLKNTPGGRLVGPRGTVDLKQGVIISQRHLHISPQQASSYDLKHGDIISVKTSGARPVTFHGVFVRSRDGVDELSFMIDTDEANAAGLKGGEAGIIVEKNEATK